MEGFQRKQRSHVKLKLLTLQQQERLGVWGGGGVVPSRIVCIVPAASPVPPMFPVGTKAEERGIRATSKAGVKPLSVAVVGKNKTTALDLRFTSGLLLLCRSQRLHGVLSLGYCVKPVFSVRIHPLAVDSILHPYCGTCAVIWDPYPIPTFALGLCRPLAGARKLSYSCNCSVAAAQLPAECLALLQCFLPGNLRMPYQDPPRSNLDLIGSKTPVLPYCYFYDWWCSFNFSFTARLGLYCSTVSISTAIYRYSSKGICTHSVFIPNCCNMLNYSK